MLAAGFRGQTAQELRVALDADDQVLVLGLAK
jgi:hypothetical protein